MIYNDNPILSNEEYKILESHYQNETSFSDRKTCIAKIHNYLSPTKTSISLIVRKVNKHIYKSLENANIQISNILENINMEKFPNQTVKELNIFDILKNISLAISEFNHWQEYETKQYYKEIIKSSIKILNNVLIDILSTLSKSNIILFKFM